MKYIIARAFLLGICLYVGYYTFLYFVYDTGMAMEVIELVKSINHIDIPE